MDRVITQSPWSARRLLWPALALVILLLLGWMVMASASGSRLSVDPSRLTIATVSTGEFREYFPFTATVVPETSVFLDVEEGGRVEAIHLEGGQWVEEGTLILTISNDSLQRQSIDTETRLLENLDQIRNTQFNRAQSTLVLRDQLLDMEYRITELERLHRRYAALVENQAISQEEFDKVKEELDWRREKRDLLQERIRQENLLTEQQLQQADTSIERLNVSLDLISKVMDSLEIRAPISGHLSSISAELGQSIARGQRIGQIDLLDSFKLRVAVDQYYGARVSEGTRGRLTLNNRDYAVEVRKIYPEVVSNEFQVDMDFIGEPPANIRRGQSVTVELSFGDPVQTLMVSKGGFYQQSAGRYVYLVSADGRSAHRIDTRFGRQNPQFLEVLEGLNENDRIITSRYDGFNDIDTLEFSEPVRL